MATVENPIENAVSRLSERFGADEESADETAEIETEPTLEEEESEEEVSDEEETEESEDEESDEEGGLDEEEPEEAEWDSLDEVIQAGSIDPDTLPVEITVAGEKQKVTLKEALNGYQRQADYDRHMSQIKDTNKKLQEERQNLANRYTELADGFALANGYWDAEKKVLKERRDSVDWAKLRTENSAEYAAAMAEFDQEERLIDEQQQKIKEEYSKVKQKASEDFQREQAQRAQEEGRRLMEAIPEWNSDKALFEQETNEIGQFLSTLGFAQEELQQFVDHRALILARKAMLFDKAQNAATQIVGDAKNPKTKPKPKKLLRPGARKPDTPSRRVRKRSKELAAEAKKTGREDIATQRLMLKLGN